MYYHTQVGWVNIISLSIPTIIMGGALFHYPIEDSRFTLLPVFFILALSLFLFWSLTVTVDEKIIQLKFGIGLIRKKYNLADIESCSIVKNKWWYGFGIRRIWKGWLYNVSGLDAVEIVMKNGKINRIGTDEPRELCSYISNRLAS